MASGGCFGGELVGSAGGLAFVDVATSTEEAVDDPLPAAGYRSPAPPVVQAGQGPRLAPGLTIRVPWQREKMAAISCLPSNIYDFV